MESEVLVRLVLVFLSFLIGLLLAQTSPLRHLAETCFPSGSRHKLRQLAAKLKDAEATVTRMALFLGFDINQGGPDEQERMNAWIRNRVGILYWPPLVRISINEIRFAIQAANISMVELKRVCGVPLAFDVERIGPDAKLCPISDDAIIRIEGGEAFVSHVKDGASI